jgi:hypothetical protein
MKNIIYLENKTGCRLDVISISDGYLENTPATAYVLENELTEPEKAKLQKYKRVLKVGTAQYRYAPEIKHSVIYVKRGN